MAAPLNQVPAYGYVGGKVQTAIGTGQTPTKFVQLIGTVTFKPVLKVKVTNDGTQRDNSIALKFSQWGTFTFTTYLTPDVATYFTGLILSGVDGITGTGDPYTHTINSAPTTLYPFTLEAAFGQAGLTTFMDVLRIIDCYMDEVKISWAGGKEPTLMCKGTGITVLPEASLTSITLDADRDLVNADAAFTFTGPTVNAAAISGDIDIKVANKVVERGDSLAPLIIPGNRTLECSFDLAPTDKQLFRDIYFGSAAGTVAVKTLYSMTSFLAKWDIAGSPDHYYSIQANNVNMTDGEYLLDQNGNPFLIKGAKGTAILGGGNVAALVSNNATAAAYWS